MVVAVLAAGLIACTGTTPPATPTPMPPTAAPVVIATPVPSMTPLATRPVPTPIAPPKLPTAPSGQPTVYVTNTGGQGLTLRRTPGGDPITTLPDGAALRTTGEEESAAGHQWRQVRDAEGRDGWVAADFLTTETPPGPTPTAIVAPSPSATSEPTAVVTVTPTWPVPLIPTITPRPVEAVPTPTRPPPESPAAATPATTTPVAPATMAPIGVPSGSGPTPATPTSRPVPDGGCHPSYPDFCIPPAPPDLNCTSAELAGRRRFTVRQPDPHRFDRDRDGIGCE